MVEREGEKWGRERGRETDRGIIERENRERPKRGRWRKRKREREREREREI